VVIIRVTCQIVSFVRTANLAAGFVVSALLHLEARTRANAGKRTGPDSSMLDSANRNLAPRETAPCLTPACPLWMRLPRSASTLSDLSLFAPELNGLTHCFVVSPRWCLRTPLTLGPTCCSCPNAFCALLLHRLVLIRKASLRSPSTDWIDGRLGNAYLCGIACRGQTSINVPLRLRLCALFALKLLLAKA